MNSKTRAIILISIFFYVFWTPGCFGGGFVPTPPPPVPGMPMEPGTPGIPPEGMGTLEGYIYEVNQSGATVPAYNATIALMGMTGVSYTDPSGYFRRENVIPGEHLAVINIRGTKGTGTIKIEAGKTTTLQVEMYVEPGSYTPPPGTRTGTLQINTSGKYDYSTGQQIGVKKIVVWEHNNWPKRWSKFYGEYIATGSTSWSVTNLPLGKWYNIEVEWYDDTTKTGDIYMNYPSDYIYINP